MQLEKFQQQNISKQTAIVAAGIKEFSQRSYADASTDRIVQTCGISKGLLFHYFGSKKNFYLSCLSRSVEVLLEQTAETEAKGDFYGMLFSVMNEKLRLCARYPAETRFVNMASRETAGEVAAGKAEIFRKYGAQVHSASEATMERALDTLPLKGQDRANCREALLLYSNALVSKYLLRYQNTPDEFFAHAQQIQREMKVYLDLMLYGIVKEEPNE